MASHDTKRFRQRALAFSSSLTVEEYLAARPAMKRLFCARRDEVRLPPAAQLFFCDYPDVLHFIALVNDALPETSVGVPVWARIAAACPRADLRLLADDDPAALEALINDPDAWADLDGVELPQLLVFDEEWQLQARWGPRSPAADAALDEWMGRHPDFEPPADGAPPGEQQAFAAMTQALALEMRVWYNSGLDRECVEGIQALLASLQGDEGESGESAEGDEEEEPQEP